MKQDADLPRVARGFTLIETLVVVAVLAIIASAGAVVFGDVTIRPIQFPKSRK